MKRHMDYTRTFLEQWSTDKWVDDRKNALKNNIYKYVLDVKKIHILF